MDDRELHQAVIKQLQQCAEVTAHRIGVAVSDGIVTLSGHVPSRLEKRAAEGIAGIVHGVKAIVENIEVEPPGRSLSKDQELAEQAYRRLTADPALPAEEIRIYVERGMIRLTGRVSGQNQKIAAEEDLRGLPGAVAISNEIGVRPQVEAEAVRERIRRALAPIASFDPASITIETSGSEVTLFGNVKSWHERGLAESAAWSVPGVTQVRDQLSLG